jgi:F-type H+-transporting ATPase subunit delta
MSVSHIAVPYAKAILNLSLEQNALEATLADMKLIASLCHSNREFKMMLKSPVVKSDKKRIIVKHVFENALSKLTLSFLYIIIRKKREYYIPEIADQFLELYKDHMGILTTIMKTAAPVSADTKQKMVDLMKKYTTKEIDLVEEINEELIGGFVLQWDDKQYDASILTQINKMKRGVADINLYHKAY